MSERNKIVYSQWTFVDKDIQSGSIYLATSLMSDTLEANTILATVECSDKSIIDFERNTPLTYYSRGQQKGIFYVQSISRIGPELYEISATSAIGLLIEGLHYGGIYTGQTVAEVLPGICGTVPYVIKTNLRDIALYGWLPVATPRDNLAQVLFAIGATIKTDLDGVLHIEGLWDGISGTFTRDRMYQGPSVDYASKVTQVVVTEHQYVTGGEETSLFEGTAQQGDIITFDEPMYNLQATGFTILESNANYAKVSAGSGTLTGNKYVHNTRQITKDVSSANEPNVKTVTEATLVSLVNSEAVAQRMVNYYQCTQTINADAVYAGENPGDLLSTWHPYDNEAVSACVESVDISLSNTLKAAETSLVGFKPIQTESAEIFDTQEIIATTQDWVVPDGVHNMTMVLMSGGEGGGAGHDGESGSAGTNARVSTGSGGTQNGENGTGGAGGGAGTPGSGGKVNIIDIEVTPGETIHFNVGIGGAGGTENGAAGQAGTPTTATIGGLTYSSDDGASSPTGYVDVVTGEVYAVPGAAGIKGGDGGDGGKQLEEGESGQSVDTATGGATGEYYSDTGSRSQLGTSPSVEQDWLTEYLSQEINGQYWTGYTGYTVSDQGRISYSGYQTTIGYVSGQVVQGTVYREISTGGSPTISAPDVRCTIIKYRTNSAYLYKQQLNVWARYPVYNVQYGIASSPAGGGGAAKGENGGNATVSENKSVGGNGADAETPANATVYGNGGDAGHGGGGSGGGGAGYAFASGDTSNVSFSATGQGGDPGTPGKGSAGANGGPGAAILYFGLPHIIETGSFVTSSNKYFLDADGRRLVV